MDSQENACIAIILALSIKKNVRCKRWMKDWLQKRQNYSHVVLLKEIGATEAADFKNYFRMCDKTFEQLLRMVKPFIVRQDTNMRESIPANERFALTLRYLATGRNFEDLKFSAVMSPASISNAIIETCEVLIYVLRDYIKFPTTSDEWVEISDGFGKLHQFYNTLGSIDGKHIAIKKPSNSGSLYYNYKGFYSIVLLAIVNAKKQFVMVDVGMNIRIYDGGVMYYSKFGELMQQGALNLPEPRPLPNTNVKYPYAFVADEAFALNVNLLKPYSQKSLDKDRYVFNKRLSRARVVVENTFGILDSRFGVLQKTISLEPKKSEIITMACCYLHNFLAKEDNQLYFASNEESTYNNNFVDIQSTLSRNSTSDANKTEISYVLITTMKANWNSYALLTIYEVYKM